MPACTRTGCAGLVAECQAEDQRRRGRPGAAAVDGRRFPTAVAYVINRRLEVLASNELADALLSSLADPRNMLHTLFHDPAARELFADWQTVARDSVEALRLASAAKTAAVRQVVDDLLA